MAQRYSHEQMHKAFSMVQNKKHWKLPIKCRIDNPGAKNLDCLAQAIPHFTGGIAQIIENNRTGRVDIRAAGYYTCIGS